MFNKLLRLIWLASVTAGGVLLFVSVRETFAKYDEPAYDVLQRDGAFEIRGYKSALVVESDMNGADNTGANNAFKKLFKYISGHNSSASKIPMTAPVLKSGGQKIAMTVPVLEVRRSTQSVHARRPEVMQFFLPPGLTLDSAPKPDDPTLKIREVAAKTFAVIRFSGFARQDVLQSKESQLRQVMHELKLVAGNDAQYAFYNAPFTLPFWRRNEVMIEIREQH